MKIAVTIACALLLSFTVNAQQVSFDSISSRFVNNYKALHILPLELSYTADLEDIKSADSVQRQIDFFRSVRADLPKYQQEKLTGPQKLDYGVMDYESKINQG